MDTSSPTTTTATPTPMSPFSSSSVVSDPTSDEQPDLGSWSAVFRALNSFHTSRTLVIPPSNAHPPSSLEYSPSPTAYSSSRWSRRANHSGSSNDAESRARDSSSAPPSDESGSDTEGEPLRELSELEFLDDAPSLGYLEEAISFLAAERAMATQRAFSVNQRDGGSKGGTSSSESALKPTLQPRRMRRRRKGKAPRSRSCEVDEMLSTAETLDVDTTHDGDSSSENGDPTHHKSISPPPRGKMGRQKERTLTVEINPRLRHSKSTPTFRVPMTIPPDPRTLQLRTLAHKLRMLFPADAAAISAVLAQDPPDTQSHKPEAEDTLIHVFIDHSNILIGFLNYMKKLTRNSSQKHRQMSHAALALILERGRPITRRALVTSSPLYQPLEGAEELGYEVRVFLRVPDTGDGQDRRSPRQSKSPPAQHVRRHSRQLSAGHNTSTESDSASRPRVRYREQGVDELLQLKLHQAIADADDPPQQAVIVLATGDGNVGQFSDEGFRGPVRTALKKGWSVELYAWEEGLSKAWMKEFGGGPYKDRFKIIGLEQFAMDLLHV